MCHALAHMGLAGEMLRLKICPSSAVGLYIACLQGPTDPKISTEQADTGQTQLNLAEISQIPTNWQTLDPEVSACYCSQRVRAFVVRLVTQPCLTLCNPVDSSVHGNSPGKNTGVSCHAFFQGIFPTWVSSIADIFYYHLNHQGSTWGLCYAVLL